MTQTIDSLFIEAKIKNLDEDNKIYENPYNLYIPYKFAIVNIIKKVKQYLTLDGKAA
jgi:hypothetical protein